jgi:hypothetical protein
MRYVVCSYLTTELIIHNCGFQESDYSVRKEALYNILIELIAHEVLNPFETEIYLDYITKFCSHITKNKLPVCYKDQLVSVVRGINPLVFAHFVCNGCET